MKRSTLLKAAFVTGAVIAGRMIYRELTKYDLNEKVILITGGSRGLGFALARQFAARGAKLAICARSTGQLDTARQELEEDGSEVLALKADLTDLNQVQQLIKDVVEHYGKLDVIVNNAGIIQVGPESAMELSDYDAAMNIHFKGPLYTIKTALPYFKEQGEGRILNITSVGGKIAVPHLLPYTASKYALVGLSEGMHAEWAKDNIRITTVVPFLMRTGSPRNIQVKGDHEKEYALFKFMSSLPFLTQDADKAANRIVKGLEYNKTEVIPSLTAKAAIAFQGIAPGLFSDLMGLVNRFLPDNIPGGETAKKGYESESRFSKGSIFSMTDEAGKKYNEY